MATKKRLQRIAFFLGNRNIAKQENPSQELEEGQHRRLYLLEFFKDGEQIVQFVFFRPMFVVSEEGSKKEILQMVPAPS